MVDDTATAIRKQMVQQENTAAAAAPSPDAHRAALEAQYGQVWTTAEMQAEFDALQFAAPMLVVSRKSDGKRGTLMFCHSPRFYYSFEPE